MKLKMSSQDFIQKSIQAKIAGVSKERLENLALQCKKFKDTNYSFVECGVGGGGCLSLMKYISGERNKIFGFDSFEGMPPITEKDLGVYNKDNPSKHVGANFSGGIENVRTNFKTLNVSMENVNLIKGFHEHTLTPENIDSVGSIAILRLDSDWYESTKVCLERLYDKVIKGGVIIIDDYGHWVGAKRAVDEFRASLCIKTPLIRTDFTEFYWVK